MKFPKLHWGTPFGVHRYYGFSWYGFQLGYWTKIGDPKSFAIIRYTETDDCKQISGYLDENPANDEQDKSTGN